MEAIFSRRGSIDKNNNYNYSAHKPRNLRDSGGNIRSSEIVSDATFE